jgi:hypothetical protein
MNKFLLTGLSVLTLAACTNDLDEGQEPNIDSKYKTVYLPLQFVTAGENVTRTEDATQESTIAGSTGDSFTTTNNLELFFFTDDGTDFDFLSQDGLDMIKEDNIKLTWTKGPNNTYVSNYVKTISKLQENNDYPSKVVAVLNAPTSSSSQSSASSRDGESTAFQLSDLEDKTLDVFRKVKLTDAQQYASAKDNAGNYEEDKFTMTNSVYQDAKGNAVYASPITADNFIESATYDAMTEQEHLAAAVPIYLERVVAKVSMTYSRDYFDVDSKKGVVTQKTTVEANADDGEYANNGGKVTANVVVLGWTIFNTMKSTYLEKDIDGYTANWDWNSSTLYRSYWAQPMSGYTLERQSVSWINEMSGLEDDVYYPFENTLASTVKDNNNREANTGAVIAAKLCDASGKPLQLSYWNNEFFSSIADLKAALIENGFEAKGYTVGDNAEICFQQVSGEPYKVIPYIKGDYAKTKDLAGEVLLWGDGRCYYYQPIAHLSASGVDGIVRNHWYKLTLTSLTGLGTPIPAFDKDDGVTVYPAPSDPSSTDPKEPGTDDDPDKLTPITPDDVSVDPTRPEYPVAGDWNVKLNITVMPWVKEEYGPIKFYKTE